MHGEERGFITTLKWIKRFLIEMNLLTKNMAARILHGWKDQPPQSKKQKNYNYRQSLVMPREIRIGQKISVGVTIDGDIMDLSMGEATSFPLACGVKMLIDGLIDSSGVHAPESGIIDPGLFMNYLSKEISNGVKLFPVITRSEI